MPAENDATPVAESRTLKRRTLRTIKYFLSGLVALVLLFAIIGAIYQYVASSAEIRNLLRTAQCRTRWMETQEAEFDAFDKSADEARATGSFGAMPLVVLSHDPKIGGRPGALAANVAEQAEVAWGQMQEELSHLSTIGNRIVAQGSAHYIQFDRPELVINAIHRAVEASRNGAVTDSTTRTFPEHVGTQRSVLPGSLP